MTIPSARARKARRAAAAGDTAPAAAPQAAPAPAVGIEAITADMTVAEVLAAVGEDAALAQAVLDRPDLTQERVTLIAALTEVAANG